MLHDDKVSLTSDFKLPNDYGKVLTKLLKWNFNEDNCSRWPKF